MNDFINKIAQDEEISINITSMIDVIFILLIFFMVSTQFKKNSLPLNLPQSENQSPQVETPMTKTLSVTQDKIELDGNIVILDELTDLLKIFHDASPDISISLECEKSVDFQRVVEILTKIQNAGIIQIGIVHDQSE